MIREGKKEEEKEEKEEKEKEKEKETTVEGACGLVEKACTYRV
jgi:hypothetical protein